MSFSIVTSPEFSCPGLHTQWVSMSVSGGTIVSVGFQNIGNAQNFWANQMYVQSANNVYVQVSNTSLTSTGWYIWTVVSRATAGAKIAIDSSKIEKGEAKLAKP